MSVIHMEPENVRMAAQKVDWAAGELYGKPLKLKNIAKSLTSVWQGGESSDLAAELRRQAGILHGEVIALQRLAQKMRMEVNQWEEADSTHDYDVATPSYFIAAGEGALKPEDGEHAKINYDAITSRFEDVSTAVDFEKLFLELGGMQLPSWTGPAIGIIYGSVYGSLLFLELWQEDSQRYTTQAERDAAFLVDLAFASLIALFKTGAKIAGMEAIKAGALQMLSGAGLLTGAVTAILGAAAYWGSDFVANQLENWFSEPSVHDAIVQWVANNVTSQSPTGGMVSVTGTF